MGSIVERKTKEGESRFRASVRIKGFPDRKSTFGTEQEAKVWIEATERSFREADTIPLLPLNVFLDRYITEVLPLKNTKYANREMVFLEYWRDSLGEKIAIQIKSIEIETFANNLYNKKERSRNKIGVSVETRRKYIQHLGHVFNIAIRKWKWMEINPVNMVDFHIDTETEGKIRNTISARVGSEWISFKRIFIEKVSKALKEKGMSTHIGIHLIDFFGLSKTSLQHLFDESNNSTIGSMYKILQKLGLSLEITDSQATPTQHSHSQEQEASPHQE